jgi:cytochrome P450
VLVNSDRILELNQEAHLQYGEVFSWQLVHLRGMSIADPECVKWVLQTNFRNYEKGPHMAHLLGPLLGQGIFVANGDAWKHQRTTAKPLFRTESIKDMLPVFVSGAQTVIAALERVATDAEPIDLQNLFMRYTLDSIGLVGFGHDIGSLHRPVEFSYLFDRAQAEIDKRADNPLREYVLGWGGGLEADIARMDQFVLGIIRRRRAEPPDELRQKSDLLSRYLCLRDPQGLPFSDAYLRDVVMNFLIAGRDTTAILLTWAFYLLARHPEAADRAIDEIDERVGGRVPTWDDLGQLPYLRAVLDETLRLYPPVPSNFKMAVQDDVLPNGVRVKAGTYVGFNAYTIHRSRQLWGDDADQFVPERWLDRERVRAMHPFQYFPFLAGPRVCLGMHMALLEAKLLAVMVLQRFRFRLAPGHVVRPRKAITMPAAHGLYAHVLARSAVAPQSSP